MLAAAFTGASVYGAARFQPFPMLPSVLVAQLALVGLVSFLLVLYLGTSLIVPMALVSTLVRDTSVLPKWVARRLQPNGMKAEMPLIPCNLERRLGETQHEALHHSEPTTSDDLQSASRS
jgi:hypothetical protein